MVPRDGVEDSRLITGGFGVGQMRLKRERLSVFPSSAGRLKGLPVSQDTSVADEVSFWGAFRSYLTANVTLDRAAAAEFTKVLTFDAVPALSRGRTGPKLISPRG
jgi:hypothetical protein